MVMSEIRGPRGPYSTGIARRQQIVDEAIQVFGSVGYNGGSLRQIARSIGVSPAAISRHFASKEDLLDAVLASWDQEVSAARGEEVDGLAYLYRLRANLEYHTEHRGMLAMFLSIVTESASEGHPARSFVRNRYGRTRDAIVENLQIAGERNEMRSLDDEACVHEARGLLAFVDGIELQFLTDPTFSMVEAFDRHWEACLGRWNATLSPAYFTASATKADTTKSL